MTETSALTLQTALNPCLVYSSDEGDSSDDRPNPHGMTSRHPMNGKPTPKNLLSDRNRYLTRAGSFQPLPRQFIG